MEPVTPRPASTVILVRDADVGIEALLLRRPPHGFAAGAWVFPGGTVDKEDYRLPALAAEEPERWARILGLEDPAQAWAYLGAAIRETWEETGVLLGEVASDLREMRSVRRRVLAGEIGFMEALLDLRFTPASNSLQYLSRWVTPAAEPRRFDTRFFVAPCADTHEVTLEGEELEEAAWINPTVALEAHASGELRLMTPTIYSLRALAGSESTEAALRRLRDVVPSAYLPRMRDEGGEVIIDVHRLEA